MAHRTSANSKPSETSTSSKANKPRPNTAPDLKYGASVEYIKLRVSSESGVSEKTLSSGDIWSATSEEAKAAGLPMQSYDETSEEEEEEEEDTGMTTIYMIDNNSRDASQSSSVQDMSSSGLFRFSGTEFSNYRQESEEISSELDYEISEEDNKWKGFTDDAYYTGILIPKVESRKLSSFLNYQKCHMDAKLVPVKSIRLTLWQILRENLNGSAIIKIGSEIFRYNAVLLRLYSCVFAGSDSRFNTFEFDEKTVPINGFIRTYKWLQFQEPIDWQDIMDVLQVACHLKIDLLIDQCWNQICVPELTEKLAFYLFKQAADYSQLSDARRYLANRLSHCFLALVGSEEYMNLTAPQVTLLLSSDAIGVNCEVEVFYSAVRWLSRNLSERMEHMQVVMRSVRFPYIPISMLFTLREGSSWPTGPGVCNSDRVVLQFRQDPEMMKVLCETMVSFNMQLQNEVDYNSMPNVQRDILLPRQWIYHSNCPFHLRQLHFPYKHNIPHTQFLDYIKTLQPVWEGEKLRMDDVHPVEFDGVIQRAPVLKRHYEIAKIIAGEGSARESEEESNERSQRHNSRSTKEPEDINERQVNAEAREKSKERKAERGKEKQQREPEMEAAVAEQAKEAVEAKPRHKRK